MAQKVAKERVEQFLKDRALLPYDDVVVATKMGVDKSNYSSYIHDRLPITNSFLNKFYKAFYDELLELKRSPSKKDIPVLQELRLTIEKLSEKIERQDERLQKLLYGQEELLQKLDSTSLA